MDFDVTKTIAFTGHRNFRMDKQELAVELERVIREEYRKGFSVFVTGMAQGFDLLAAEAVIALKQAREDVLLVCAIPFRGQQSRYCAQDKQRYSAILDAADKADYLSESYYEGCFLRRNDYMLENSSGLIAHFDGSQKSGTGYTVRRSQRAGKKVINII